ncbi:MULTISPECIES: DUF397 domain-containing protein [unclassified Streptomyces]|uniref:DUF397 domain-containing protein n=1 Tax=unclassified Streptomyces TaxID=2593676 RepID=UPI003427E1C9
MTTTELAWFKSSHSGSSGDSCVEVALSIHDSGQVETVHVRDSKVRQGPQLALAPGTWNRFLRYATRA